MTQLGSGWRRRAIAPAVVLAAVASLVAATGAWAAGRQSEEPSVRDLEPRAPDLEPRVRDLSFRSSSVDNSERVEQEAEQTSVTLAADVLFEFDRADLTSEANQRLDELADQLADLGPREVSITGHTDSQGEPAYNQDLSERRAEAVRAALDERLDDEFTFQVAGQGEDEPVAPNENADGSDNPEGRALNRRVVVAFPS